jgi:hypothetical protein
MDVLRAAATVLESADTKFHNGTAGDRVEVDTADLDVLKAAVERMERSIAEGEDVQEQAFATAGPELSDAELARKVGLLP